MRTALILVTVLLGAISGWLYHELRTTWGSFNSHAVTSDISQLYEARLIAEMIEEDRLEEALLRLQKIRAVSVIGLDEMLLHIGTDTWRWARDDSVVDRAKDAIREEQKYLDEYEQSEAYQQIVKVFEKY